MDFIALQSISLVKPANLLELIPKPKPSPRH
jgi:hypothetical protein